MTPSMTPQRCTGQHEIDCGVDAYMKNSPRVTPQHRGSICYSYKSSPHPHHPHPPRVDETVGMAISDFEGEEGDQILVRAQPARIYQNPLNSGGENRLDANESRMALSESSESDAGTDMDTIETRDTPIDTPMVVSSVKSLNDPSQSSDAESDIENRTSPPIEINSSNEVVEIGPPSVDHEFNQDYDNHSELMMHQPLGEPYMEFDAAYRNYGYPEIHNSPEGLGGEYHEYENNDYEEIEDDDENVDDESSNDSNYDIQYGEPLQRPPPPRRDDSDSDEVICLDSD